MLVANIQIRLIGILILAIRDPLPLNKRGRIESLI